MKKKILFCLACDINLTGTPLFVKDVISSIGGGYDVTVFTPCSKKCDVFDGTVKIIELNIPLNSFNSYMRIGKSLGYIFEKEEYDVVHINTSNMHLACILASFFHRKGAYVITHSHNVIIANNAMKKVVCSTERRSILKHSNKLLSCSKEAGNAMFGEASFEIINNYIDCKKYMYSTPFRESVRLRYDNPILLGHIGAFNGQKNQMFLIELMPFLGDEYGLILVGEGEKKQECIEYCKEKNINNVYFVGNTDKVEMYYSAIDILLLPSLHEGFGRVILEAMVSNLNIVVSDRVPRNPVFNCSYLPLNQDDWIDAIKYISANLNVRKNSTERIYQYGYDKEAVSSRLRGIYEYIKA